MESDGDIVFIDTPHTLNDLTPGTFYEVRVRSYFIDSDGDITYSEWGEIVEFMVPFQSTDKNGNIIPGEAGPIDVYSLGVLRPRALRSIPLATPKVTFVPEKNAVIEDK